VLAQLAEEAWGADPTRERPGSHNQWTDRLRLILASALQVDNAIFFSALITVAAFVPLFTMVGAEGAIFGPMARTYGFALAGGLLATFTVTPVLTSFLLPEHVDEAETIFVRALRATYTPVLHWSLAHRKAMLAIGVGFLAVIGLLGTQLGSEFLPHLEEGNFWIRITLPPSTGLEAGEPATKKFREILHSHPEVITVVTQHGRPDNGTDASPFFNVEIFATLTPFDTWPRGLTKDKLTDILIKEFSDAVPGATYNFSQYIEDNLEEGMSGVKGVNSLKIVGPNLAVLEKLATGAYNEMTKVPGMTDVGIFHVLGQPNLNIKVDREKTARYGLNTGDVNTVIQAALGGTVASTLLEGDRQFNITVRLAEEYRKSLDSVGDIKVGYTNAAGTNSYIPLRELATITLDDGASYIYHEESYRYIPIKFTTRGRDLGSTVAEAKQRIADNIKLPVGYRLVWAGEFEELEKAQKRLEIVVPLSLAMILVLLYGLFGSLRDSLLALAGIPFAIAGGIVALYITGLNFSISAAIGFISLFGVSVMDGILMITYYNWVHRQGMHAVEAMAHAAEQRMRPMLMTALSACIGLFPAALSTAIGSQVQRPLATVVVGGMLIGPIMLLVVVPALRMFFLSDQGGPQAASPSDPDGHLIPAE
jgi:heavy metal efflux system protein